MQSFPAAWGEFPSTTEKEITMQNQAHAIASLHLAYMSLIGALHKEGILPISSVVNALGNQIEDETKRLGRGQENPATKLIYDGLLELEVHLGSGHTP
jgi:hypothetical protein